MDIETNRIAPLAHNQQQIRNELDIVNIRILPVLRQQRFIFHYPRDNAS
jgi:hypothetical protein